MTKDRDRATRHHTGNITATYMSTVEATPNPVEDGSHPTTVRSETSTTETTTQGQAAPAGHRANTGSSGLKGLKRNGGKSLGVREMLREENLDVPL